MHRVEQDIRRAADLALAHVDAHAVFQDASAQRVDLVVTSVGVTVGDLACAFARRALLNGVDAATDAETVT